MSAFLQKIMELCDVQLRLSSSDHTQTNGSSKIMDRMVQNHIRFYYTFNPQNRKLLQPSAEFSFNTSHLDANGHKNLKHTWDGIPILHWMNCPIRTALNALAWQIWEKHLCHPILTTSLHASWLTLVRELTSAENTIFKHTNKGIWCV